MRAWLFGILWIVLGCSDPMQPESLEVATGMGADRVLVTAGVDHVVIDGFIGVPLSCYELHGSSRVDGHEIELTVRASAPGLACLTISGVNSYRATIRGLE